jgi:hypothetical protein
VTCRITDFTLKQRPNDLHNQAGLAFMGVVTRTGLPPSSLLTSIRRNTLSPCMVSMGLAGPQWFGPPLHLPSCRDVPAHATAAHLSVLPPAGIQAV